MGRELKRVAMDFDWPMGKTWVGYLNPYYVHSKDCVDCKNSGWSPKAKHYYDQWYGYVPFDPQETGSKPFTVDNEYIKARAQRNVPAHMKGVHFAINMEANRLCNHYNASYSHHISQADVQALIDKGRLMDFTHTPRTPEQVEIVKAKVANGGNSWLPESNGYVPTAEEVNNWSLCGFGHDSLNAHIVVKARCKREGIDPYCATCKGNGSLWEPGYEHCSEKWRRIDPPKGEGYQLWETTSEGSPSSPIFTTIEALCDWCADNATTFADFTATAQEWRAMLDRGVVAHTEGNMVFM